MKIKLNNLTVTHPELCKNWSPKNEKGPEHYTKRTAREVFLDCPTCKCEYLTKVANLTRVKGETCPKCRIVNNLTTTHPELCKEWSLKNEKGPEHHTAGENKKVWWDCPTCDESFDSSPNSRTRAGVGRGCPYCSGRKAGSNSNLTTTHPELVKEWSPKNEKGPEEYTKGSNKKVWWDCPTCEMTYPAPPKKRTVGRGCSYCAGKRVCSNNNLTTTHSELCKEWSLKNEKGPEEYINGSGEKVWWDCSVCNDSWNAAIVSRARGAGCPYCSGHKAGSKNNLAVINPDLCKEWSPKNEKGPEEYTPGSGYKVWWDCSVCNDSWNAAIFSRARGGGCPYCSGQRPIKKLRSILKGVMSFIDILPSSELYAILQQEGVSKARLKRVSKAKRILPPKDVAAFVEGEEDTTVEEMLLKDEEDYSLETKELLKEGDNLSVEAEVDFSDIMNKNVDSLVFLMSNNFRRCSDDDTATFLIEKAKDRIRQVINIIRDRDGNEAAMTHLHSSWALAEEKSKVG